MGGIAPRGCTRDEGRPFGTGLPGVLSWHFDRQDLGKARGISRTFGIRDLESGNRNEVFRKGAVLIIPH